MRKNQRARIVKLLDMIREIVLRGDDRPKDPKKVERGKAMAAKMNARRAESRRAREVAGLEAKLAALRGTPP